MLNYITYSKHFFRNNFGSLKNINNQGSCPALSMLYARAKMEYNLSTLFASNIADFNGLIGE